MQVMIWTELKKLRRSRMLLVALFGLCMVLVIVTAQGFFAGGNEAYGMEPEWYLTGVQSLGTLYALPGIIALFGSYIICRESQEDVLKSLLLIPVNMGKMVVAKEEAARIIERANKEAELEKQKAADDVKQQIVAVSAMIASKLIAKSIDESESNAIIEQTLNEMGENTWRN